MARRTFNFVIAWLVVFAIQSTSWALISSPELNTLYPKAISDLKEAIVKGLGFQAEDFKVSGFDVRDALVGHSVAYEFDIEIDNKVLPLKLLEDVHRWEYVDLPIFRVDNSLRGAEKNGLVEKQKTGKELPVLAPFQLAGPMELWIQDGKDMRLSLPHDVDAGELRKVILADGAVVTVKGARSVSLRHPVELPLPLNRTHANFASGLLNLAEHIRQSSHGDSLLSLRIVGPTSLTAPATSSSTSANKLKLKRLAPGLVELSSRSKPTPNEPGPVIDIQGGEEATTILTPDHFTALWPLTSVNGSNPNLLGFEALLSSVLGSKADEAGSFKLLKADVSARTFVKMGFGVEKKVKEGDELGLEAFPGWRTKPKTLRMHFEVLGKVDGDKVVPERVMQVNPVLVEDSVAPNLLLGNMTMSNIPIVHPPPNAFAL